MVKVEPYFPEEVTEVLNELLPVGQTTMPGVTGVSYGYDKRHDCPSIITTIKLSFAPPNQPGGLVARSNKVLKLKAKPDCCDRSWFELPGGNSDDFVSRLVGRQLIGVSQQKDAIGYTFPPGTLDIIEDPEYDSYLAQGETLEEIAEWYGPKKDKRGHNKPWSRTETNVCYPVTLTLQDPDNNVETVVIHRCNSSNGHYSGWLDIVVSDNAITISDH